MKMAKSRCLLMQTYADPMVQTFKKLNINKQNAKRKTP